MLLVHLGSACKVDDTSLEAGRFGFFKAKQLPRLLLEKAAYHLAEQWEYRDGEAYNTVVIVTIL